MGVPSTTFLAHSSGSSKRLANATAPELGIFPTAAKAPPASRGELDLVLAQVGTRQHHLDSAMEQTGGKRTYFQPLNETTT